MVSVENILVEFGGFTLLDEISFVVNKRDRIALTGRNGAGKSTLLKIMAGIQMPTSGTVSIPREFTVGYLPQVLKTTDTCSLQEEAAKAFEHIFVLQRQTEALQNELAERIDYESKGYHQLIERLNHNNDMLALSGMYQYQSEVEKTLLGLGFKRSDFERPTSEFSGGWRMRIELAKVLLQKPDLILLDEPTNHLDIESIQWLESFLAQNAKAVVLVSHDRAFLDNVTTRTIEISLGKIYDYKVPYTQFLELRKERREQQLRSYENQQKMIQDTEAFIERFRYKATKAVQVQSRIKQLDKLERLEVDEIDTSAMNLRFPPAPHSGAYPVIVEDLRKAYGEHTVIQHVNLTIERGEKVAFVGRNGEGKSTLVKCILGEIPYDGNLKLGHLVKIAYFAQNQPLLLDENLSVFDTIDRVAVGDIRTKIRDILGAFMFGGENIDKKVKVLSGGERSRLAMIQLLLSPANLLILDEPTNHLDIRSKGVLKQAIREFQGTVIVVSHDRDFLDGLVDKVYEFSQTRVIAHLGGINDFLQKKKMESLREIELRQHVAGAGQATHAAGGNVKTGGADSKANDQNRKTDTLNAGKTLGQMSAVEKPLDRKQQYEARKEEARRLRKLQQAVEKCEAEVLACESALAKTEQELSTPEGAANVELHTLYAKQQKALETAMSYWEEAYNQL